MSTTVIEVAATYPVTPTTLWAELRRLERHVNWMADAETIEFVSNQREGVGTRFVCRTRVGPLRTRDVLSITSWVEGESMGVRHEGAVTGEGVFSLEAVGESAVRLLWREQLSFPWWGLGPIGVAVARPALRRIWRGNLRRLGAVLTADEDSR
jgi:hypothetical protein